MSLERSKLLNLEKRMMRVMVIKQSEFLKHSSYHSHICGGGGLTAKRWG